MRLHQRVGRINRYGQTKAVEVYSLRNEETVESLIWQHLEDKLQQITRVLGQVMDDPEDMMQLVLGMASPSLFQTLFADAPREKGSVKGWFDSRTATLGGQDMIEAVRDLIGHCVRFDFGQVSAQVPRVDLPDLQPFLVTMLELNKRRVSKTAEGLTFKTPEAWEDEPGVRASYERMTFDRRAAGRDAQRVLGVGHKVIDLAVIQAQVSGPTGVSPRGPAVGAAVRLPAERSGDGYIGDIAQQRRGNRRWPEGTVAAARLGVAATIEWPHHQPLLPGERDTRRAWRGPLGNCRSVRSRRSALARLAVSCTTGGTARRSLAGRRLIAGTLENDPAPPGEDERGFPPLRDCEESPRRADARHPSLTAIKPRGPRCIVAGVACNACNACNAGRRAWLQRCNAATRQWLPRNTLIRSQPLTRTSRWCKDTLSIPAGVSAPVPCRGETKACRGRLGWRMPALACPCTKGICFPRSCGGVWNEIHFPRRGAPVLFTVSRFSARKSAKR